MTENRREENTRVKGSVKLEKVTVMLGVLDWPGQGGCSSRNQHRKEAGATSFRKSGGQLKEK